MKKTIIEMMMMKMDDHFPVFSSAVCTKFSFCRFTNFCLPFFEEEGGEDEIYTNFHHFNVV